MRLRARSILIGMVGGLFIGGTIGVLRSPLAHRFVPPVPLAEDTGAITKVVMQYHPEAGAMVAPIYRRFLAVLDPRVDVTWVVSKSADLDDLRQRLGTQWPEGRCRSVITGMEISTWAKDRFLACEAPAKNMAVLCAPARTRTANPLRTNDGAVPYLLAVDPSGSFSVVGTKVDFDGGDFLATSRYLFASPLILQKNPIGDGMPFASTAALERHLHRLTSCPVSWLGMRPQDVPPHHVGMYLTIINGHAAVGDVRLGEAVLARHLEDTTAFRSAGGVATASACSELSTQLDHIAERMQSLGYTVARVPLLPSMTPRAWMSYNNGIVDMRDGVTTYYMPTFGAKALDATGAESFRRQFGCSVRPIDCSSIWHLGGSLHCLISVVGRR